MLPIFFPQFSFKTELKFVSFAFFLLLSLPFIAVILLTTAGIDIISNNLATHNQQSDTVDIHNPDGSTTPITAPMAWPVTGIVMLEFGVNDLPYQPFHTGIDIANPSGQIGDPITPFMDGTVTNAEELSWGYGKYIQIDNGNNISSIYAHLSAMYVYVGEKVHLGQVIGEEGQTGWATGPHLHFQINVYGIPVNPRTFLGQGNPIQ